MKIPFQTEKSAKSVHGKMHAWQCLALVASQRITSNYATTPRGGSTTKLREEQPADNCLPQILIETVKQECLGVMKRGTLLTKKGGTKLSFLLAPL